MLPLGPPAQQSPPVFAKSLKVEGIITRYTYLAPAGRSPAELFRNYKLEFQRSRLDSFGCGQYAPIAWNW